MTDRAAFFGTYAEIRNVRSRKVTQIIVEIPIERYAEFVAVFGGPNPAEETCIALARMDGEHVAPSKPKRAFSDLPAAQQAALACQREAFQRYVFEQKNGFDMSEVGAISFVRAHCDVESRSELTTNADARKVWGQLYGEFNLWLEDANA